jgi:UDP-2-acetamido-3-amino-2,3-dideoxy-glucuronate N-acetyltransferase
LLNDPELDSVIIATPPSTHYDLTKKAMSSGKDVLVEKPMTFSSEQALELCEISSKESKILMVGHVFLYHSAVTKLKKMIDKGEIGDLLRIHSYRNNTVPSRKDTSVLWDFLPHDISLMNHLTSGIPESVYAEGKHLNKSSFINCVDVYLRYSKGFDGFAHGSWVEPERERKMVVIGTEKRVIFDDISNNRLQMYDLEGNKEQTYRNGSKSPLEIQCLHFRDCVTLRKTPLTDGYNGYVNVKILEAIQNSIDNKKEVYLEIIHRP